MTTATDERWIIGIDPGKSGGIALLRDLETGLFNAFTYKLSGTEADTAQIFCELSSKRSFAFIERVHAFPKQGISSAFNFGMSYGFLRGLLIGFKVPFETVSPSVWQRAMGCMSKGNKNVTKARAQELFPDINMTHAVADALLIAEYGRRKRRS